MINIISNVHKTDVKRKYVTNRRRNPATSNPGIECSFNIFVFYSGRYNIQAFLFNRFPIFHVFISLCCMSFFTLSCIFFLNLMYRDSDVKWDEEQ